MHSFKMFINFIPISDTASVQKNIREAKTNYIIDDNNILKIMIKREKPTEKTPF